MGLIGNSFVVAGVILTLLVGAVAWVVTRQVVAPVRRAGEVAQRLSAGKLNERMPTRGEDDLALLATSFNGMADSLQSQIRQLEGLSAVQQRFVSDVSHELRTPLTTIRMAVDLIHESREDFEPTVGRSAELLAGELDRFEDAARRPARDQPVRRRRRRARRRAGRPARHRHQGGRGDPAARRAPGERRDGARPGRAGRGRGRRAPGRADHAQPASSTPSSTVTGARSTSTSRSVRTPSRSSSRTTASACARARRPTSSPGSGAPTRPGPAPPAAPVWACRSRSRTRDCTTAGCRPGASVGSARGSGSPCRSGRVTPCTGRRCRSARRRTREPGGGRRLPSACFVVALVLAGCGGLSRSGDVAARPRRRQRQPAGHRGALRRARRRGSTR